MAVWYIDRNIFNAPDWISNKSDSINKPQADYFEASAQSEEGDMLVTNGSTQAWGGALVSRKRPVPSSNGKLLNWLAFSLEVRLPKSTVGNVARLETDWKVCTKTRPNSTTKIRNVCNYSTQWNADTGMWQIDLDPPAWVDSGFVVPTLTPDVWHKLEYRHTFDEAAQTFSILSIQWDSQIYMMPASLQTVPMSLTNWEQVSSGQLQSEVYAPKSTALVEYRNGVFAWSDERITQIPPPSAVRDGWWPRQADRQQLDGGTFDIFGVDASPLPTAG